MSYAWNALPNGVQRVTVNTVKFDYNSLTSELVVQKPGKKVFPFGNVTSLTLAEDIVTAVSADPDGDVESQVAGVDPGVIVLTSLPVWYDIEQS